MTELYALAGMMLLIWAAYFFEFIICPFRLMFGFSCPGCGLTRASVAMFHGDWHHMWTLHPLAPILFPLVIAVFINIAIQSLGWTKRDFIGAIPTPIGISFFILLIGLWIARLAGWYGNVPDPLPPKTGILYHLISQLDSLSLGTLYVLA